MAGDDGVASPAAPEAATKTVREDNEDDAPLAKRVAPPSEALPLASLGLSPGDRVEVLWEVEMSDGAEESVWWKAKIEALDAAEGEPHHVRLVYAAQHGFGEEARRVALTSEHSLWDGRLCETLPWRLEGDAWEVPQPEGAAGEGGAEGETEDTGVEGAEGEAEKGADGAAVAGGLSVGTSVKSRFQGGERYCAGMVAAAHSDGTYDVLYEDSVLEQGVPREMIEVVELTPAVKMALGEGGEVAAESTEDFFSIFVTSLTSGAKFAALPPDKQAAASNHVKSMKPHFEAELESLRDQRGWGAMVTGDDIKILLPKVMARARAAQSG